MTAAKTRAQEFRDQLANRVMVADGAMGTMLYSRGVFINRCFDELNLSAPDMVRQIHQEYVKAGAEILETNTFGANRPRLARFGIAEKLKAINHAGVRLAREAARDGAFVAGAIGPLGRAHRAARARLPSPRPARHFREQIEALVEAGVDLLILETFGNLDELREAIPPRARSAGDDMAIIAQVTIDDFGHLPGGTDTETFTREMDSWPVDVDRLNCSVGPKATLETIEQMMQFTTKPMSAMPNAGLPMRVEGRNIYLCSPEYMAQYARRLLWAGVEDHRRLLRHHARSHQADPLRDALAAAGAEEAGGDGGRAEASKAQALAPVPVAEKSQARARSWPRASSSRSSRSCRRAVWMRRGRSPARSCCAEHGIDCINVPDGPRASARMSAQVTCQLIQQQAGIEAVLHFCCRDRNILGIQSRTAGRARRRRAQPDLHHRRSAAHGHVSGRHGGVRRGRHRTGQHRATI